MDSQRNDAPSPSGHHDRTEWPLGCQRGVTAAASSFTCKAELCRWVRALHTIRYTHGHKNGTGLLRAVVWDNSLPYSGTGGPGKLRTRRGSPQTDSHTEGSAAITSALPLCPEPLSSQRAPNNRYGSLCRQPHDRPRRSSPPPRSPPPSAPTCRRARPHRRVPPAARQPPGPYLRRRPPHPPRYDRSRARRGRRRVGAGRGVRWGGQVREGGRSGEGAVASGIPRENSGRASSAEHSPPHSCASSPRCPSACVPCWERSAWHVEVTARLTTSMALKKT